MDGNDSILWIVFGNPSIQRHHGILSLAAPKAYTHPAYILEDLSNQSIRNTNECEKNSKQSSNGDNDMKEKTQDEHEKQKQERQREKVQQLVREVERDIDVTGLNERELMVWTKILNIRRQYQLTSESEMTLMYDVPNHVSVEDLAMFLGNDATNAMTHMQIVVAAAKGNNDAEESNNTLPSTNSYILLMKHKSTEAASDFVRRFDLRRFNTLDDERCLVTFIDQAVFEHTAGKQGQSEWHFPFVIENQNCPVCLDLLQPSQGCCISILCTHIFHIECLARWSDSSCPVCRYGLQLSGESCCQTCGMRDHLWLCLLCGHVGCGRNARGHANRHANDTQHNFAQDLITQRVWDYSGSEYVHRLIASKEDGKLVSVAGWQQDGTNGIDVNQSAKLECLLNEYNFLLASELEQQRYYFEQQLQFIEQQEQSRSLKLQMQLSFVKQRVEQTFLAQDEVRMKLAKARSRLQNLLNELSILRQKHERLSSEHELLSVKLSTLPIVATDSNINYNTSETELEEKDATIRQLEEQLNDMQFYIKTQQTVSKSTLRHITNAQFIAADHTEISGKKQSARERLKAKLRERK